VKTGPGIIPPGFFMMLKDTDLHEDDLGRHEEMQTSFSGHVPPSHPHPMSSDSFMSLVQAVRDRHFRLPQGAPGQRARLPSRSAQRHHSSTKSTAVH
jgi:hypothetical protein